MKLFSTGGSHVAKKSRSGKKATALTIALVLLLVVAIGGTLAVLKANTGAVINTFTAGESNITIEEETSQNEKTVIAVKNDGTATVYVRVALIANIVDDEGNVTAAANVPGFNLGNNWFYGSDGYYYYKMPIDSGTETENLLGSGSSMELSEGMQVTVLADSIQSSPANAVATSWNVRIDVQTGELLNKGAE